MVQGAWLQEAAQQGARAAHPRNRGANHYILPRWGKTAQGILRHTDAGLTTNIYTHA